MNSKSKEALENIKSRINSLSLFPKVSRKTYDESWETIEKDLQALENIKSKTLLLYSDRKRIAQEYEKWCKDSNTMISDTTNMITWLLCFKLKEWLENEYEKSIR